MASIFTFEPDVPRVSSPWIRQLESQRTSYPPEVDELKALQAVSKLEPEPQDGPVEYKLHLLLRPRRSFARVQRVAHLITGPVSRHNSNPLRSQSDAALQHTDASTGLPLVPLTKQARQHRLEQLTTQLLWRLQQSSSNHASSASNVILPSLPDASSRLQPPPRPARLINGLEESQGALYEIGVADDGTFVGLSEDEMEESLNNLRTMAACLGCQVEVVRMVPVGQAEWLEEASLSDKKLAKPVTRRSKLVVAEALVQPYFTDASSGEKETGASQAVDLAGPGLHSLAQSMDAESSNVKGQLRVSLTGATLSGKSSLLGTLTTSALDNARGKSRLSMLKHRHEISSGLTSSVSQELLGYHEDLDGSVEVVNYAGEDIISWVDIHTATSGGRLVLVSDSAGHPRYRRTAVKSLVGWAPHWTLLCVPGNEVETPTPLGTPQSSESGSATPEMDLSTAYMDLCLRLHLPLVVVITKLDAASKLSLRATLARILTLLKDRGRRPVILPATPTSALDDEYQRLPEAAVIQADKVTQAADFDMYITVPIVMTSAVQGTGIESLHSLLYKLPIPTYLGTEQDRSYLKGPLFHIEDVYNKAADPETIIVAGYVRRSHISVGDELYIGPFSLDADDSEDSDSQRQHRRPSSGHHSRSFPGALKLSTCPHRTSRRPDDGAEWRPIRITSVRNLRLPVKSLRPDQVGTIGFVMPNPTTVPSPATHLHPDQPGPPSPIPSPITTASQQASRIRKGMVILRGPPAPHSASSSFTARFLRHDLGALAVGSQVVVYIASVRASARVVSAAVPDSVPPSPSVAREVTGLGDSISSLGELTLDDDRDDDVDAYGEGRRGRPSVAGRVTHEVLLVTMVFETGREFVELDSRVLVMPGGGPGVFSGGTAGERSAAALEGFVGSVVDVAS